MNTVCGVQCVVQSVMLTIQRLLSGPGPGPHNTRVHCQVKQPASLPHTKCVGLVVGAH